MLQARTPFTCLTVANGDTLAWGARTYVMGIINVTPDSFSGDALSGDISAVVNQAVRFQDEGADILDIGAESTRPGHEKVSLKEELARLMPLWRPWPSGWNCPSAWTPTKQRWPGTPWTPGR